MTSRNYLGGGQMYSISYNPMLQRRSSPSRNKRYFSRKNTDTGKKWKNQRRKQNSVRERRLKRQDMGNNQESLFF